MSYVHFIWMGTSLPEDAKLSGPISLAKYELENINMVLWVPQHLFDEATIRFSGTSCNIHSVDSFLNGDYSVNGRLNHIDAEAVQSSLRRLFQSHAYVAQKDLLSFALLAEFGGYFFDTTITFLEKPLLNFNQNTIKVPQVSDNAGSKMDWKINPDGTLLSLPLVDLWALFSPTEGHEAFKAMVITYTQTIKEHTEPYSMEGDSQSTIIIAPSENADALGLRSQFKAFSYPYDILSSQGPDRNFFISASALYAIYRGIEASVGELSKETIDSISWKTKRRNGEDYIDELALKKTYHNSWRIKPPFVLNEKTKEHASLLSDWQKIILTAECLTDLLKAEIKLTPSIKENIKVNKTPRVMVMMLQLKHMGYQGMIKDIQEPNKPNPPKFYVDNLCTLHQQLKMMNPSHKLNQEHINVMLSSKNQRDMDIKRSILLLLFVRCLLDVDYIVLKQLDGAPLQSLYEELHAHLAKKTLSQATISESFSKAHAEYIQLIEQRHANNFLSNHSSRDAQTEVNSSASAPKI